MGYDNIREAMNMGMNSDHRHRDLDRNFHPQKAQFIIDMKKAEEGLSLVREMEGYKNHNEHIQNDMDQMRNEMSRDKAIIAKFVETFGDYKIEEKSSMHRRNAFDTDEIIMPETNSYKLYKKIFKEKQYPYKVESGHKITMIFEVTKEGYVIESRKITRIKTPEEIEAAQKKRAKAKKAKKILDSKPKEEGEIK